MYLIAFFSFFFSPSSSCSHFLCPFLDLSRSLSFYIYLIKLLWIYVRIWFNTTHTIKLVQNRMNCSMSSVSFSLFLSFFLWILGTYLRLAVYYTHYTYSNGSCLTKVSVNKIVEKKMTNLFSAAMRQESKMLTEMKSEILMQNTKYTKFTLENINQSTMIERKNSK